MWTTSRPASSQRHLEAAYHGLNQAGTNIAKPKPPSCYRKICRFGFTKADRYTGRPSPYYKESHRKLRDYVRAWCDEASSPRETICYPSTQAKHCFPDTSEACLPQHCHHARTELLFTGNIEGGHQCQKGGGLLRCFAHNLRIDGTSGDHNPISCSVQPLHYASKQHDTPPKPN